MPGTPHRAAGDDSGIPHRASKPAEAPLLGKLGEPMHTRQILNKRLPGLCRVSSVALVTPLRDGMNLVAKEYVAAQDPADPGVLVLSRFAGAAEQLRDALLVNPYDIQGTAQAIQRALQMSHEERCNRHAVLLDNVRKYDVHWWCTTFLQYLQEVPRHA